MSSLIKPPRVSNDFNNTIPSYPLPPYSNGGADHSMPNFAYVHQHLSQHTQLTETSPRPSSLSLSSTDQNSPYQPQQGPTGVGSQEPADHVRVVHSRPKPQCWEHGCNGRQFSTFSNLLRHQREKSGQSAKSSCPNCGAEFTRTTARNGHMAHEKCKQRRNS